MKKYKVETTKSFDREFKKLDKNIRKMILSWINKNLVDCENPRLYGKPLTGNLNQYWRYRIGSYRIITIIEDDRLIITALNIGHRKDIYK